MTLGVLICSGRVADSANLRLGNLYSDGDVRLNGDDDDLRDCMSSARFCSFSLVRPAGLAENCVLKLLG